MIVVLSKGEREGKELFYAAACMDTKWMESLRIGGLELVLRD
jgi:hypothetical protein